MNVRPEYTLIPVKDAAAGFRMLSFNEADAMVPPTPPKAR